MKRRRANRWKLRTAAWAIALALALPLAGCSYGGRAAKTKGPAPAENVAGPGWPAGADELSVRISQNVIGEDWKGPALERIAEAGVVNFLLPAEWEPFQYFEPGERAVRGFNADLAREVARILLAKPNIALEGDMPEGYMPDIRLEAEGGHCGAAVPFFFHADENVWTTLCAAQKGDPKFEEALEKTMGYLNESGIFREIYLAHFGHAREAKKASAD